jgi:Tol biopolymer transport system component
MKLLLNLFLIITFLFFFTGCPDDTTAPVTEQFKGYVYYSTINSSSLNTIRRINMKTQMSEELFINARFPDITPSGDILCINKAPESIIYSDLTGANKTPILLGTNNGPVHTRVMDNPRISYDEKYIAYGGGGPSNVTTFIIDAKSGELLVSIGDLVTKQPCLSPSWAPDGSLYFSGWTSMNNGIFKLSSDFQNVTRIDPNLTNVSEPSVSPDGQSIAFIRDNKLWTMDINGSNPKQHYVGDLSFKAPTWSPDSKFIAVIGIKSGGYVYVFDLDKNTFTQLETAGRIGPEEQLSWVY